jgi:hypothetical protein
VSESPSAVRLFAIEHPSLARGLRARLERRQQELVIAVGTGYAQDWADYKERVGVIKGLGEAIEQCKLAENELTGES